MDSGNIKSISSNTSNVKAGKVMATGNTGSGTKGTKKVKGKFRTPKLSEAQKRANKVSRAFRPKKGTKTHVSTKNSAVPF